MGNTCGDKIKVSCGKRHNARCVDYEGTLPENSSLDPCGCTDVHSVLGEYAGLFDALHQSLDLSGLGGKCLTYPATGNDLKVKDALIKLEEEICSMKETLDSISGDCPTVFTQDISCLNLDMSCLVDPCGEQITDMKALLQALIFKACT